MSIANKGAKGTLYIVATPIGNLDDISARAIAVLGEADLILAEDTRHSRRLLKHFAIETPVQSCHEYNERGRTAAILERLGRDETIALISDAGTPLISDPGFHLVAAAHAAGVRVCPVPGPCSLIAALSVAGIATDRFTFIGYLPAKPAARRESLVSLAGSGETLVMYETPHRIRDTLSDLCECFGASRGMTICRELTKQFETLRKGRIDEIASFVDTDANQQKGEFVLVIEGAPADVTTETEMSRVLRILLPLMPLRTAAAVAAELLGESKNSLYHLALKLKDDQDV